MLCLSGCGWHPGVWRPVQFGDEFRDKYAMPFTSSLGLKVQHTWD